MLREKARFGREATSGGKRGTRQKGRLGPLPNRRADQTQRTNPKKSERTRTGLKGLVENSFQKTLKKAALKKKEGKKGGKGTVDSSE